MSIRDENAEWAREVLADPRTVVLDTETTGLYGYACEVSVFDGKEMLLDTLVNPQVPVEAGARRVHGIADDELAAAPLWADVWPKLKAILADRRVLIWNAEFDIGVINRELARLSEPAIALTECAMRRYSDWAWDMEDARYQRLNGGHRAGEDCRAVFERLREMASTD